jgi:hypothetical protein
MKQQESETKLAFLRNKTPISDSKIAISGMAEFFDA